MGASTYASETILDVQDQPLKQGMSNLLKAFDRLMTVGTYYSTDHEQYKEASRKACGIIVESIGGRSSVILETGSAGLMLEGQVVNPQHRNVRQLHELLVSLNIARLEIDHGLSPEDLRLAFKVLHEHKLALGSSTDFREVKIQGLPPTVRVLGANLVLRDEEDGGIDDLLADIFGVEDVGAVSSPEQLAKQFLDLITRVIENLRDYEKENGDGANGGAGTDKQEMSPQLRRLAEDLRNLVLVDPDPENLLRLVHNARRALDLSRDSRSVDLVFRMLRKEVSRPKPVADPENPDRPAFNRDNHDLDLFRAELDRVSAAPRGTWVAENPVRLDYLGICFQILQSEPPPSLEIHLLAALEVALGEESTGPEVIDLCAAAVAAGVRTGHPSAAGRQIQAVARILRAHHLDLLARFWYRLWSALDSDGRGAAWPYLANDVLLGMDKADPADLGALLEGLGSVHLHEARQSQVVLFGLPCMQEKSASPAIFTVPAVSLYALHVLLLESPLADWHGPRIYRLMMRQPPNQLTGLVIQVLGEYRAEDRALLTRLLEQQAKGTMSGELKVWIVQLLLGQLETLPQSRRHEEWVDPALFWLGQLDHEAARSVFERVLTERRLLFFRAWPEECRSQVERMVESWNNASAT